jgi:NADH:ubiquinone oxidoreductase subunit H
MGSFYNMMQALLILTTWAFASMKVVFIFCAIVMVRICTPRFGLGAITRLAWGSLFTYITLFFIIYITGMLWL